MIRPSKIVCCNNWVMLEGQKYYTSRNSPQSWLYTLKMPSGREYKGLVDKGLRYNSVLENERGVEGDQDCCQREKT